MRFSKALLPFLMLFMVTGLYSFTASDSVSKDSTFVETNSFKVQNLKQSPETAKNYEVIQKLEFQKSIIQERIDSVFNLIDSLENVQPDTTRQHKRGNVLPHKVGSIESLRKLQKEPTQRGYNTGEEQSNYFATITAAGAADNLPSGVKPDNHQKEHLAENSHKRGNSLGNSYNTFFSEINGSSIKRTFGQYTHSSSGFDFGQICLRQSTENSGGIQQYENPYLSTGGTDKRHEVSRADLFLL